MPKKSGVASAGEGDVPAAAARGKRAKADAPVAESAAASSPKAAKKRKSEGVNEGGPPAPKGGDKVVIPKSELKPISLPAGKTLFKVSHIVAARRCSMRPLESRGTLRRDFAQGECSLSFTGHFMEHHHSPQPCE